MPAKRIVLFVPYGSWIVHHQVDAIIGTALTLRGCEVVALCCDGIFKHCSLAGKPPREEACKSCSKAGKQLFSNFHLPIVELGIMAKQDDFKECKEWVDSLSEKQLLSASFEGKDISKRILPGVYSHFLTSEVDLKSKEVRTIVRSFLYNGALLKRIYHNFLEQFFPDHVLCFHSMLPYYRIILDLSRDKNIPVLVHDRGFIDDSFQFISNENIVGLKGRTMSWKNIWKDIPLNIEELKSTKQYLIDRKTGINTNFPPMYRFSEIHDNILKQLRIPVNSKVITFCTSSDWELAQKKWDIYSTFESELDAIKKLIDIFKSRNEYLIIRHHPNLVGKTHTGFYFIQQLFEQNRKIPKNVRIIMPTEKITSYSLIWHSDAVLTYGSTTGIESVARGLGCASFFNNLYTNLGIGIELIQSVDDIEKAIERILLKTQNNNLDDLRQIYRATYYLFFRLSYKFKSFGIVDKFHYDIRVRSNNEILEGNDKTLDHICNHIINDTPLYPEPTVDRKQLSDKEETIFLAQEFEKIRKKRQQIKNFSDLNKNYHEPLITVIRIRQNGIRDPKDTFFSKTIKISRHKNIELMPYFEMALPYFSDTISFFQELSASLQNAQGEYIYFGTDNVHINESFYSTAIDFLEKTENKTYDGVITGAWICDKNGYLNNEILTDRKTMCDFSAIQKAIPSITNPAQILTLFIWRKTALLRFVSIIDMNNIQFKDISSIIYTKILSDFNFYKLLVPLITIYGLKTPVELTHEGIELLIQGQLTKALCRLDKVKAIAGDTVHMLNYCRALTKAKIGKLWEALAIAETQLMNEPDDEQTKLLLYEINKILKGNEIQYSDISSTIEKIEGKLEPNQEKYLFDIVKSLPKNATILEIGSCYGRLSSVLGFACLGTERKIFSIDTFFYNYEDESVKRKIGNTFFDLWNHNIDKFGLKKYIIPLKGLSHELIKKWKNKQRIDFVFIDDSNDYNDVLRIFEGVYPYVNDGGWIALNNVKADKSASWRVWQETAMPLLKSHEYITTIACGQKQA